MISKLLDFRDILSPDSKIIPSHVGDERRKLIFQPEQFSQTLFHHCREGEKSERKCWDLFSWEPYLRPQGVAGGSSVEDNNGEVHPLHQLHHLCIAHSLVNPRESAQQFLNFTC